MTQIKICGLCREEDARSAAQLGADYLGLVLSESPRRCDARAAAIWLPRIRAEFTGVGLVGVFVRPSFVEIQPLVETLGLDYVQLHGLRGAPGFDSPRRVIRAIAAGEPGEPDSAGSWAVLIDSSSPEGLGGTGRAWDWRSLPISRPARLFVAGGLDASNVGEAIRLLHPFAVDASSRLEEAPGRKDPARIRAFIAAVRDADAAGDDGDPAEGQRR